jgi:hypothetical protein
MSIPRNRFTHPASRNNKIIKLCSHCQLTPNPRDAASNKTTNINLFANPLPGDLHCSSPHERRCCNARLDLWTSRRQGGSRVLTTSNAYSLEVERAPIIGDLRLCPPWRTSDKSARCWIDGWQKTMKRHSKWAERCLLTSPEVPKESKAFCGSNSSKKKCRWRQ